MLRVHASDRRLGVGTILDSGALTSFQPGSSAFLHLSSWEEHSCAMPSHLQPSGAYLHCTTRWWHSSFTWRAIKPRVSLAVHPEWGHSVGRRASVCSLSSR